MLILALFSYTLAFDFSGFPSGNPTPISSNVGDSVKIPLPPAFSSWTNAVRNLGNNRGVSIPQLPVNPEGGARAYSYDPYDVFTCPSGQWALTFDDGPSSLEGQFDALLSRFNTVGTYFVIGGKIVVNQDWANSLLASYNAGHQIALHSFTHRRATNLTDDQFVSDIIWNALAVKRVIGKVPRYFRPPYQDIDARIRGWLRAMGLKTVIWSVDSNDFSIGNSAWTVANATNFVKNVVDRGTNNPDIPIYSFVPRTEGFISLEHSIDQDDLLVAQNIIPLIKEKFRTVSVASCVGGSDAESERYLSDNDPFVQFLNSIDVNNLGTAAVSNNNGHSASSVAASSIRCGVNWADANGKCNKACVSNADCPNNAPLCYASLSLSPCSSAPTINTTILPASPLVVSTTRCGSNYTSANTHCYATCASNSDCPSGAPLCYASLDPSPCSNSAPRSTVVSQLPLAPTNSPSVAGTSATRCGSNWLDANTHCYSSCAGNNDCPGNTPLCYALLDLSPCSSANSPLRVTTTTNAAPVITTAVSGSSNFVGSCGCSDCYTVKAGDTCSIISSRYGIQLSTFYSNNPSVSNDCRNLQVNYNACVSNNRGLSPPAPDSPSNIPPANTLVSVNQNGSCRCSRCYTVVSGDTCSAISSRNNIALDRFYALNPSVAVGCLNLQVGYVACLQ